MPQITIGKGLAFYEEAQALPGVKRVAGMVKQDIELVTGVSPAGITFGQGSGCLSDGEKDWSEYAFRNRSIYSKRLINVLAFVFASTVTSLSGIFFKKL